MSILEQLKKSLSPELIGARPFCDFFYMISCVENFIFVLHPYSLQHHYQAWANWISNFLLLCFLFKCFFFSLLCWYIELERYLVVHRKALLEALVEELPIDIPFLFQAHFHQNQSTKRVIDCTHSNGRWNHYQGKSNYHQLVSSTFKYIMQILQ